jgi:hypothetical protein
MIKIERSNAVNPTILRNGVRQPVTLNMTVTAEELASLEAASGTITYSIDELEVKVVDFQPSKPAPKAPVVDTVAAAGTVATAAPAKPVIPPPRKIPKAPQA